MGPWYHRIGRGVSDAHVSGEPWVPRAHGRETTFQEDLEDWDRIAEEVRALTRQVKRRHRQGGPAGGAGRAQAALQAVLHGQPQQDPRAADQRRRRAGRGGGQPPRAGRARPAGAAARRTARDGAARGRLLTPDVDEARDRVGQLDGVEDRGVEVPRRQRVADDVRGWKVGSTDERGSMATTASTSASTDALRRSACPARRAHPGGRLHDVRTRRRNDACDAEGAEQQLPVVAGARRAGTASRTASPPRRRSAASRDSTTPEAYAVPSESTTTTRRPSAAGSARAVKASTATRGHARAPTRCRRRARYGAGARAPVAITTSSAPSRAMLSAVAADAEPYVDAERGQVAGQVLQQQVDGLATGHPAGQEQLSSEHRTALEQRRPRGRRGRARSRRACRRDRRRRPASAGGSSSALAGAGPARDRRPG